MWGFFLQDEQTKKEVLKVLIFGECINTNRTSTPTYYYIHTQVLSWRVLLTKLRPDVGNYILSYSRITKIGPQFHSIIMQTIRQGWNIMWIVSLDCIITNGQCTLTYTGLYSFLVLIHATWDRPLSSFQNKSAYYKHSGYISSDHDCFHGCGGVETRYKIIYKAVKAWNFKYS